MYFGGHLSSPYLLSLLFVSYIDVCYSAYLGCYVDQESRKLTGSFEDLDNSLTPEVCKLMCKHKGYLYAGLQYGRQCFCGDERPKFSDKKPESDCNFKCSGDPTMNCGGNWRNSIYESGFTGALYSDNRYEHLGCFIDQELRELSGYFQDLGERNVPEVCVDLCKGKGFAYAGLQFRTQCFCGNEDPKPEKRANQQECNAKCPGDTRFNCGGTWRNNVYTTVPSSPYLGCYVDLEQRKLSGEFQESSSMTPQTCINFCREKGYLYAGVQYSSQCFCGDEWPKDSDKKPDSECSMKCAGDSDQNCGGDWRNSVFRSGFTDALISDSRYEYVGCFIDQTVRELGGYFEDLGNRNAPEVCVDICNVKGFAYAGLQFRSQCFCGDKDPKPELKVNEYECKAKCTGDNRFNCGSDWRNNVYKTGNPGARSMYLGCYADQDSRNLKGDFKDFTNGLTPQLCMDHCKDRGFPFAGVQFSSQCFCGDTFPTVLDKRPQADCNMKCTGDQSQLCGGERRNSVYMSGFTEALIFDSRYEYQGCYADQEPRELTGHFQDLGENNSPERCIILCKENGFTYAGLQYRTQCFCGNEEPKPDKRVDQQECKAKCPGDKRFNCGSDWRNNVYKTEESAEIASKYLGCYYDEEPDRRFQGDFKDFPNTLTHQTCIDYCKNKGYPFAGLQYSSQCFCGDFRPSTNDKRPEAECSSKCSGDQSQNCGAGWRNSAYETGYTDALFSDRRYEYVGCFVDQEPRSLSGHFADLGDNNSPATCIARCKEKGYVYAGLQYRSQCLCGDEHPVQAKRLDQRDCKYKCTGDKRFNCGGDWRNSVYKTGNADTLVSDSRYEYLGCYIDQEPRELIGPSQDFSTQNSPEKCVTSCKQRGYVYAGLQYATQCFCGDQTPKEEKRVDQKDCKYKCPADNRFNCGGDWRNNVYQTGHSGSSVARAGFDYVGCYIDQSEPRLLSGEMLNYPETLTPSLCVGVCQKKGYVYAGLQYSSQCFCGDNEVTEVYKAKEEDCHMKCSGDRSTICGGDWRITLYRTGNKAPRIEQLAGNEYVGCYRDQVEPRLLRGHQQDFPDTLTPQLCVALCKRKGYVYAGLQVSVQCWCGDEALPASAKVSDSDCSTKCTGDRSVFCGGHWRLTIYKTGNSGSSVANIGYKYIGCYRDISFPRKLSGFMAEYPETLTPQHCITVCKQKGFQFAGLQLGTQCFCGNEVPSENDKKLESDCNAKCSGDLTALCGGTWRNTIYSTAENSDEIRVQNMCATSVTRVNGKAACQNEVVFEDNFDSLSTANWSHIVQIPREPDYQLVIYKSDPANAYTANGRLIIKPTLLPDAEVRGGDLHLESCTGKPEKDECGYKARSYVILPPVQSARLTTRKSFNFQYGKLEISAKLPAGDWLVPEIWLEPKNEQYGPGYASGKIRIALSRGNKDLKDIEGNDISSKQLESGVLMGVGDNIRGRTVLRQTLEGWHNTFHNYSVTWTPENIVFMIDGQQPYSLVPNHAQTLSDVVGFSPDVTPVWSSASKIAPFDSEFYISLGVSVGGVRNFPDNIINSGKPKPWKNLELKALLNFWKNKSSWLSTWDDDTALLQVDYVKVTAL